MRAGYLANRLSISRHSTLFLNTFFGPAVRTIPLFIHAVIPTGYVGEEQISVKLRFPREQWHHN